MSPGVASEVNPYLDHSLLLAVILLVPLLFDCLVDRLDGLVDILLAFLLVGQCLKYDVGSISSSSNMNVYITVY